MRQLSEFFVRSLDQLRLQRAADKYSDHDLILRRAAREFLAGETGGQDSPPFDHGNDKAEARG